uniref:Uncharacterized protein n=1 Tax=Lygus hesperus TaxID=30085 RepID=A0A0K8S3L0_LYGHE
MNHIAKGLLRTFYILLLKLILPRVIVGQYYTLILVYNIMKNLFPLASSKSQTSLLFLISSSPHQTPPSRPCCELGVMKTMNIITITSKRNYTMSNLPGIPENFAQQEDINKTPTLKNPYKQELEGVTYFVYSSL